MPLKTPPELFHEWLGQKSGDARVAVVVDSDRLLADAKVLEKSMLVDPAGREWHLAVFRGDDLAFRLSARAAIAKGRMAIILTRGVDNKAAIDVSCVADILTRNEAGPPFDASVPAFFRRITPKINCPPNELRRFSKDLLARLDHVQQAAEKLTERWGKPDSWGRGQVAAMVLLAYHPEMSLNEIWPDEIEPTEFVAHVVRLLVATPQVRHERELVLQIIRETARDQVRELLFWAEAEPEELAAYLVLRDLANQVKLQNPGTQLAGLQIFGPELDLTRMESISKKVIETLKNQEKIWAKVGQAAEVFFTPRRAAKVLQVLPAVAGGPDQTAALLVQAVPAILRQQLQISLQGFLEKPSLAALDWVAPLSRHPLLSETDSLSDSTRQCRAGLRLLLALQAIEQRLGDSVPRFQHADALLDWYVGRGHHLLELDLAQASHYLAEFDHDGISEQGHRYLFGVDELRPTPESLKGRVVARLEELNIALAAFVRQDGEKFARGARSARGFLREHVDTKQLAAGTLPGRVWVLIFDGMRLDTWEAVVRPLLGEYFKITEKATYCLLPSYTEIARTGVLAGGLPSEWKGFKGDFTWDEAQLFAVNMGLTAKEAKTKLRYVTGADTTVARKKIGFTDKDAAPLNLLIYPISDEEAHEFGGDLASFNNTIRSKILGDKVAGIRGILDDLLKRVAPEDTVLLTSDHGFTELQHGDALVVTEAEAKRAGRVLEESVRWRHIFGFAPENMPEALKTPAGGKDVWMAVGRRWFRREGTKGVPRYSHGGLSLAEVVVPGVLLRRVTEKAARVELQDVPHQLQAHEDEILQIPFSIRNVGNADVEFEVHVSDNLGQELLLQKSTLAPATSVILTAEGLARYRETAAREPDPTGTVTGITVRLRHTGLDGVWRDALDGLVTVPVNVKPKAVKFDTGALEGFDEV